MSNETIKGPIGSYYHYLLTELADPRTNDWFLVTHPVIFPIVGFYLYFVTKLGPRLMEKRAPYEFKFTLIIYNAFQVALSVWMFQEALFGAYWDKYSFKCEPVNFSREPHPMRVAQGVYIFYMAKISELLDTVFFVLRKKNNQVTFLHLYHHTVMPLISWGVVKYYPGGHGIFVGFINSFVHIIMYSYYMFAAMGPQFQKYLWWKKYITNLQMIQFCLGFLHNSQLLFYDCGYPRFSMFFTLPNAIFFYYLFNNFYNQAYTKKGSDQVTNGQINVEQSNGVKLEKSDNGYLTSSGMANGGTHNGLQNGYHHKTL